MTFRWPGMLAALVLIPVWWPPTSCGSGGEATAAGLAAQGLVTTDRARRRSWRRHLQFALFTAALALLVIAVARPMATIPSCRAEPRSSSPSTCRTAWPPPTSSPLVFHRQVGGRARSSVSSRPGFGWGWWRSAKLRRRAATHVSHADVLKAIDRLSLGVERRWHRAS